MSLIDTATLAGDCMRTSDDPEKMISSVAFIRSL